MRAESSEPEPPGTTPIPAHRYTAALAAEIEVALAGPLGGRGHLPRPQPDRPAGRRLRAGGRTCPKLYVLDMFPYPSGDGLHVGHPLGLHRHRRLRPLQADDRPQRPARHGLRRLRPARRAVRRADRPAPAGHHRGQRRQHAPPARAASASGHDPRRSVATTDVAFYRWTQWIFLQIFGSWYDPDADRARPIAELEAELAAGTREPDPGTNPRRPAVGRARPTSSGARSSTPTASPTCHEAPVNWCPGLGTVLANEEVTADGRSERGNFPVFRRPLKQWMMRITAYADRLIDDLDLLDWPDSIKLMQRNWIGRSEGADGRASPPPRGDIDVFTTRPDTLFGATYMVLAPEHPLVDALRRRRLARGHRPALDGRRRHPGGGGRRPTARRPAARASSTARPRTARRPASSPAPSPPTRSTASRSRSSSPTTC